MKKISLRVFIILFTLLTVFTSFSIFNTTKRSSTINANATPYFKYENADLKLRAKFFTTYYSSSPERKSNIKLASKSIDGTFLDAGAEFSFNKIVGDRTEKNGYKNAKIILKGQFVDGVGGGVCQVSTTLYNAVLLSGLKITESHPHSLPVNYIAPSFDAMVSSGSADLKFVNVTSSPILIKCTATDSMLTIYIYGEKMHEQYIRQSTVTEELPAPPLETVFVTDEEYPELLEGEQKIVRYSKKGFLSEGSLIKVVNGKVVSIKKIRNDKYNGTKGLMVIKKNETKENENKDY